LYWMFGVLGVILGMALIAAIYFYTSRMLMHMSVHRIVPLVGYFAFLARAAGLQEIHTIYAISSPVILLAYVYFFDWLQRRFFPRRLSKQFRKRIV